MNHSSLLDRPPVLVDIGASGHLFKQWKLIAPYSICVAFDADTRDFVVSESENKGWKKLYSLNRLVARHSSEEMDFYLTRSPHCSSSLAPDNEALEPWAFSQLFEVEKIVKMPAIELQDALSQIGIDYIDWYKTDSQGADLRIFDSLNETVRDKIIAAEFEPGIIDSYKGEDKLHQLMACMDKRPFWVSHMNIKGSQRIDQDDLATLNTLQRRGFGSFLKMAPGWCEIDYINNFENGELGVREHLLGWVFSSIKGEHGFALHLAKTGKAKYNEPLFDELSSFSRKLLSKGYLKLGIRAIRKVSRMVFGEAK